ncbi:MAG: hypothetical protein IIC82_05370 [Chloroflexi bacterium]|nr:hypothetical protein [Chloroflexota bacterium]
MPNIHDLTAYLKSADMGIDPDVYTASTYTSSAIDAQGFTKALFSVHMGTLGSSATVNFKVQDSDASGGSYVDVLSAAIEEQTQGGTDASDSVVLLEVDIVPGRPFLKGVLVLGTATSDLGASVLLYNPRSK